MIFVTGGTGFLGRHLVPALCRAGHRVRILTRHPAQNRWLDHYTDIEIIAGDLRDQDTLVKGMAGCRYVVHAGGLFRFWGASSDFEATNVIGTRNVLEAALDAEVERLVHISTIAVIGRPDKTAIMDETYPPRPVDAYQYSKLQAEQLVRQYHSEHQLPAVILRPGAYYGPFGNYAFNRLFFTDPMRGITMQVDGGKHIIFPVYIGDVAQGVLKALERGRDGEIYHISGEWISHKEAFDIIYEEAGLRWPRLPIPGWLGIFVAYLLTWLAAITKREPFWPINLRSYVYNDWRVSTEKAQRELGFVSTPFRIGVRKTLTWYRAGRPDVWDETGCGETSAK
ncbi:MAG: hypothetical protein CUN54_04900 [Phototrophicales bacterium]|nr:MAG: hypothetical protein CUN54_04900 [Phototrophicales bacterium]